MREISGTKEQSLRDVCVSSHSLELQLRWQDAIQRCTEASKTYLWLVGNERMIVIVVIIVPHSSIPY